MGSKTGSLSPKLKSVFADIEKQYGEGAIMRYGDEPAQVYDVISTGIPTLNTALGVGGLRRGQPVEIFGPEATGKTTLALHIIAEAQKLGGVCAYIDVEHALDLAYAAIIGVDVDNLLLSQPGSAEEALDIAQALCDSGEIAVFVVDSIAALVPRAEIEGDIGDSHMGLQPRLMGQAMRKLKAQMHETNTLGVFINQIRYKLGVIYGNPEVTPGGEAMKFAAGVRMRIKKTESIKNGSEILGNKADVYIIKNKWAPPFKHAEFDIIYGEGVSRAGSLIDEGVAFGVIKKSGTHYSYEDVKLGNGREAAKQYLKDHPELFEEIARKLLAP